MQNQLRINFFGAPSRGKSETAARVYSELKSARFNAGLVQEWIKGWALRNFPIRYYDQIYVLGKQHHLEYELLKAGVKNVVTDSPIWLSVFYAPQDLKHGIAELIREYETEYPSLNILLLHDQDAVYEREGRYQTAGESLALEHRQIDFFGGLQKYPAPGSSYTVFRFGQKEEIKNAVLGAAIK